jgi:N-acetylglucosamine-6-phosphate deacetylase
MASFVPACAAGVAKDYGSIEVGKRADLIAFDEDFKINFAIVGSTIALDNR